MENYDLYIEQVEIITKRNRRDLEYLLYKNKNSYAFAIFLKDSIVGFQGYVSKPFLVSGKVVPTFRSEFTIAMPELRGTGIYPEFYKFTMNRIVEDYGEVYIWGETGHRGFLKFGYKMYDKYSFYQIFAKAYNPNIIEPKVYDKKVLKHFLSLYSKINPIRFFINSSSVSSVDEISFEQFKSYETASMKSKIRLYFDEDTFYWRYVNNNHENYKFITYNQSLIIINDLDNSIAKIVDIYCANKVEYANLIAYLVKTFDSVIFHGNFYAVRTMPYFWINLFFGFVPFLFGGGYVEYNDSAKHVSWWDNPLYDSWHFGVG